MLRLKLRVLNCVSPVYKMHHALSTSVMHQPSPWKHSTHRQKRRPKFSPAQTCRCAFAWQGNSHQRRQKWRWHRSQWSWCATPTQRGAVRRFRHTRISSSINYVLYCDLNPTTKTTIWEWFWRIRHHLSAQLLYESHFNATLIWLSLPTDEHELL